MVAFGYLILLRDKIGINKIVNAAAERSAYSPTVFKIYDRSTQKVCDRLVIIEPFDWYLWAVRNELYILNPESTKFLCGPQSMATVQVFGDYFREVCLNIDMSTILDRYTKTIIPKYVSYEIDSKTKTFTIFSAINLLVKNWITFDPYPTVSANAASSDNKFDNLKRISERDDRYHRQRYKRNIIDSRSILNNDDADIVVTTSSNSSSSSLEEIKNLSLIRIGGIGREPIIVLNDERKSYNESDIKKRGILTRDQVDYSKVYSALRSLG